MSNYFDERHPVAVVLLEVLRLQAHDLAAGGRSLAAHRRVRVGDARVRVAAVGVRLGRGRAVLGGGAARPPEALAARRAARHAAVVVVDAVVPLAGQEARLAVSVAQRRHEMIDERLLQLGQLRTLAIHVRRDGHAERRLLVSLAGRARQTINGAAARRTGVHLARAIRNI